MFTRLVSMIEPLYYRCCNYRKGTIRCGPALPLFPLMGRSMAADEYRRQARELQRRAMSLPPGSPMKVNLEQLAEQWMALADHAEWLEQRYGPLSEQVGQPTKEAGQPTVQQQQQQPSLANDPKHWRQRAAQMRTLADEIRDEQTKETMLRIANDYERLAGRAEQRAKNSASP